MTPTLVSLALLLVHRGLAGEVCAGSCAAEAGAALLQSKFSKALTADPVSEFTVLLEEETRAENLGRRSGSRLEARAAQGRALMTAAVGVRRAAVGLASSRNVTNIELTSLIDKFISNQAVSSDKCPAKLMEAKHQLNDLHTKIGDMVLKVNATESLVQVLDLDLQEKIKELKELDEWRDGQLAVCDKKREEDIKMWLKLREEMKEMREISRPQTSMNISGNAVGAFKLPLLQQPKLALLQVDGPELRVVGVQRLVESTKSAAASMAACSARNLEAGKPPAFLETEEGIIAGEGQRRAFPNCTVDLSVEVSVGNATKKYSPPREIMSGNHAPYPCEDINPGYKGMFWLNCFKGELQVNAAQCLPNGQDAAACTEEQHKLETIYVEAYVELARLVAEYEDLANSTACPDIVMNKYKTQRAPISEAADTLTVKVTDTVEKLQAQRPVLEDTRGAEEKLRKHVEELGTTCAELPMTTSDLHKVRKAIDALSLCPGLTRPEFVIPKWAGSYVVLDDDQVDATAKTDADIDKALNFACVDKFGTETNKVRAASTAEIEAVSVEDQPRNNTASVPLIGTCPHCAGVVDDEGTPVHKSGHARVCWDPEADLDLAGRRTDCSTGGKAALCVYDRGNIRKSTTSTPPPPPAPAPEAPAEAAAEEAAAELEAPALLAPEASALLAEAAPLADAAALLHHSGRAHRKARQPSLDA